MDEGIDFVERVQRTVVGVCIRMVHTHKAQQANAYSTRHTHTQRPVDSRTLTMSSSSRAKKAVRSGNW